MPIGFWAVSRQDVKSLVSFYLKDYHKQYEPTKRDIDILTKQLREKLDDTLVDTLIDFATKH